MVLDNALGAATSRGRRAGVENAEREQMLVGAGGLGGGAR